MMKLCCAFLTLLSLALSAPVNQVALSHVEHTPIVEPPYTTTTSTSGPVVDILESGDEHNEDGSYHFHYRGADGTHREETAVVKNAGTEEQYLEINGSYSFLDDQGKEVVVNYTADNHGFVPSGSNIPDAIALAAKENSMLPPVQEKEEEDEQKTVA